MTRGDEVVEDLVGDCFVEDATVAELDEVVKHQRFQFDAAIAGRVGDADFAEVRAVLGQTDVNSGQLMAISKSRSGLGLGNVSSVAVLDMKRKF